MNKKWLAVCAVLLIAAALLFVPIPFGHLRDGGTRVYAAVTYKVVVWNRLTGEVDDHGVPGIYQRTSVFRFPDNFKDIEELWEMEMADQLE